MEQKEMLGFVKFHNIMKKYILNLTVRGQQGDGAQEAIYGRLFQWAYERAEAGVPPEAISRWIRGKESVSRVIRKAAVTAPKEYGEKYAEVFQTLKDKKIFSSTSKMREDFLDILRMDKLQSMDALGNDAEDCEVMAFALIAALTNDSIRKEVRVKPSILNALKEADAQCREKDNPFRSPYILHVLLTDRDGLFLQALNKLQAGFGNLYREKTGEYAAKSEHRGRYEERKPEDENFIFYAKKLAFYDERKEADEIDLVQGLFLTDSKTVQKLKAMTGGGDAVVNAMREIVSSDSETTTIQL